MDSHNNIAKLSFLKRSRGKRRRAKLQRHPKAIFLENAKYIVGSQGIAQLGGLVPSGDSRSL